MAGHSVRYNGIIYIIPNDELYQKYRNGEAFIDKYGRLIDSKSKKVIKELEHKGDQRPIVQKKVVMVQPPEEHPVQDAAKQAVAEGVYIFLHKAVDWTFDVGVPYLWNEHIVPFFHRMKKISVPKESKSDSVLVKSDTRPMATEQEKTTAVEMTKDEADTEKRKVLYHWLGMLSSLKKLYEAGEIDNIDSILLQLTEPVMLTRVNALLEENPNLLETDRYILLHSLLGRDLYEDRELIPISVAEITKIAESYRYAVRNDRTEDSHNE